MKFVFILLFCFPVLLVAQSTHDVKPLSIGEYFSLQSEILDEERRLNIYLPNSYKQDSLKAYPVIYLLDGSMDEDFIHISGLVQFCSFSWIADMPETIVVGISNVDRKRDFTFPTSIQKDKEAFPTTGESASFIQFMKEELQPLIQQRYRTNDTTTLMGQSLGGLLATEVLLNHPDMFDNYIITSPSLWWNNQSLLNIGVPKIVATKGVFISVGKEGKVMQKDAKSLYKKIRKALPGKRRLFFQFFPDRNHGDVLHEGAYAAFRKLFR